MKKNKFHQDALEELEDKFDSLSRNYKYYIESMCKQESYKEGIASFFRDIHTIKALVLYTNLENMSSTIIALEDVLSVLRYKNKPITQEIAKWLYTVSEHISHWSELIRQDALDEIENLDSYTLHMVKCATISLQKPADILKKLTILLIESDKDVKSIVVNLLAKKVAKLYSAKNTKEIAAVLSKIRPDILITSTQMNQEKLLKFVDSIQKTYINMPIVFLSNSHSLDIKEKFPHKYADCFIEKQFKSIVLEEKLLDIAKRYYTHKEILVKEHDLTASVTNLKPLPNIVFELQNALNDPESTTKDIANIISKEPILTAKMLQAVNSSLYDLQSNVTSIRQAISLLGKAKTSALSIKLLLLDSLDVDVSSYGITQSTFNAVSKKRLDLAMYWCSKISLSVLPVACTSALIGNLGQLLINMEVKKRGIEKEFYDSIRATNPMVAEITFFQTTCYELSADILAHWGLDAKLVDAIRYSYNFDEAHDTIKNTALINYVLYNSVSLLSDEIDLSVTADMANFLEEMNFSKQAYLAAVERVC